MSAAKFLDLTKVDLGFFCDSTADALTNFQQLRGLPADGVCDVNTWTLLVESSWLLGSRLLYLTSPQLRGDDVELLQTTLAKLGFHCGRVDGILGPKTISALSDFQLNYGLVADGVCGEETLKALDRISGQSGEGPGVVSVREYEQLRDNIASSSGHRIVIGHFGAAADVARGVVRALRSASFEVALVDSTDEHAHARTANAFDADVYVAIALGDDEQESVLFYQSETTISAGGYLLATELQHRLSPASTPGVTTVGSRLPVLRETTMPAAVCLLGLRLREKQVIPSITTAIEAWCKNPLARAE